MPIDPQTQAFLDHQAEAVTPRAHTSVAEARSWDSKLPRSSDKEPVHEVFERLIAGPGGELRLRLYRPTAEAVVPALVFLHGGGHVVGTLDTADDVCRALANQAGCLIASVEYRLAPEHPFPAAVEDALAALTWIVAEAEKLGIDPARVAVGGSSAGGNLAAAVALLARDQGGPPIAHQLLIYPVVGHEETESRRLFAEGYYLAAESIAWYHDHYVARPEDDASPYVAPLLASDLSGLPSATIVTAEFDPLRDEAELYAERLREAGVPVQLRRYADTIHGFVSFMAVLDVGREALADMADSLRRQLNSA